MLEEKRLGGAGFLPNFRKKDEKAVDITRCFRYNKIRPVSYTHLDVYKRQQSTLANKIRLLRLAPELRSLILEHRLTERHARALLKLEEPKKQRDALDLIVKRGLNVSQAEALIAELGSEQKMCIRDRLMADHTRVVFIFHVVK